MNSFGLILSGIGSFPAGMKQIKKYNLDKIIINYVSSQKPLLKICLGFQLLFGSSEEFEKTKGLNIL